MSDLISRRAAIKAIDDLPNCYNGYSDTYDKAYIIGTLEEVPTIDAVPVTRCRDCKHRKAKTGDCYGNGLVLCNDGVWRDMEFFCADGERSEE